MRATATRAGVASVAASIATALLLWASSPAVGAGWLAWVALVPAAAATLGLRGTRAGRLAVPLAYALYLELLLVPALPFGLTTGQWGDPLFPVVVGGSPVLAVSLLLVPVVGAILYAVRFGEPWLSDRLPRPLRTPALVLVPALAWTALDFVRAGIDPGGLFGPLFLSQHDTAAAPLVALAGPWLLTLAIVATGYALALPLVRVVPLRSAVAAAMALPALVAAAAIAAVPGEPGGRTIVVAAVQPGYDTAEEDRPETRNFEPGSYEAAAVDTIADLARLTRPAAAAGADVVVWPEATLWVDLERHEVTREALSGLARSSGVTLVVPYFMPDPDEGAALVVRPDGSITRPQPKQRPMWFLGEGGSNRRPPAPVAAGPVRLGTLLGVDAQWPGVARRLAERGASLLASSTHDWHELAPEQRAFARLHAVATGVPVVRADWRYGSAVYGADGDELADLGRSKRRAVAAARVAPTRGTTPYVDVGDVLGWFALAAVALVGAFGLAARRPRVRVRRTSAVIGGVLLALCAAAPATAASPFPWRGIVEGPYGRPWDHAQRARVLRWMPRHGFNAYVHAPKDDLYQRTSWRDPYPAAEQADFDREIGFARSLGVEWIPNLSPAAPLIPTPAVPKGAPSRDLCFSCPEDLEAVVRKFEPFRRAGSRTFMISFDDVTKAMTHPEDLARYGPGDEGFGRANGDFLSRLRVALRRRSPEAQLLTVGADYSGTSDTNYLKGLRSTLRPGVEVMWTGTSIPSKDFAPSDARAYARLIGRKPLVWDNWTNNDTAGNFFQQTGPARIFLGPYKRRADVAPELRGFFFNPMNEADLNLLPLASAGAWLRDPAAYQRRRSWLRGVRKLTGRERGSRRLRRKLRGKGLFSILRAFAEGSYSTKLDQSEAPTFVRRSAAFLAAYRRTGAWPKPAALLFRELSLAETADSGLARLRNRAFYEQATAFLESTRIAAGAGRLGTELLGAERPSLKVGRARRSGIRGTARAPDPDRASELRSLYGDAKSASQANPRFVYGWRGGTAFDVPPYPVPPNVMDVYFDQVDELDEDWRGRADTAARGVAVTLDGRPVRLRADGSFRLRRSACGHTLVATDAAGGRTVRTVPRCHRRRRVAA